MLYSISLAQKLGAKGLVSVSLHPGVIMETGLSSELSKEDLEDLGKISHTVVFS
jgi:acetylglutamate kinase